MTCLWSFSYFVDTIMNLSKLQCGADETWPEMSPASIYAFYGKNSFVHFNKTCVENGHVYDTSDTICYSVFVDIN